MVSDTGPNYARDSGDARRAVPARPGPREQRCGAHGSEMKSATELINEAKAKIRQVTPEEAMRWLADGAVAIDCREPNEWNLGHIPGALHIPRGILETHIEGAVPRGRAIVLYCASGNRSALAADTLQQMGYQDVVSMSGGFRGWAEAGGDIDG